MPIMVTQTSAENEWSPTPVGQWQQWLIVSINLCRLEDLSLSDSVLAPNRVPLRGVFLPVEQWGHLSGHGAIDIQEGS